jgi:hypothetical protein
MHCFETLYFTTCVAFVDRIYKLVSCKPYAHLLVNDIYLVIFNVSFDSIINVTIEVILVM